MANKYVMAGVMGWPVAHSRSPINHNHWIRQYGLQGAYGLFPVQPDKLEDAIRGLPALGLAGCNITIPHKVKAMQLVDVVDPLALRMGAINTIVVTPEARCMASTTTALATSKACATKSPTGRPMPARPPCWARVVPHAPWC